MDLIERLKWLLAEYQAGRNPLSENATCSLLWEIKSEFEKRDAEHTRLRSEVEGARAAGFREGVEKAAKVIEEASHKWTWTKFQMVGAPILKAFASLSPDIENGLHHPGLQTALPCASDAGAQEMVAVPKRAIAWLMGEAPGADGKWFGESQPDGHVPRYWWRSRFRALIDGANHSLTADSK